MTVQLYCFGESGHSYKAALALELAGIDWEVRFVDFFTGEARGDAYKQVNAMAECPTYVDGDLVLTQSGVIMDYIAKQTGKFGAKDEATHREILRWVLWDNHKGSSQFGMTRFLMNFLSEDKRPAQVIAFMQARVNAALGVLDAQLAQNAWVAGTDGPTIADFSCCSYLFYPEDFGFDRASWPNIDRWLSDIEALDGWKHPYDLMPRAFPAA